MNAITVVAVLSRWVHILSVVTAIGGSIFVRFVLQPVAGRTLAEDAQGALRTALVRRWRMVVHVCITLLLISGGVNFWLALRTEPPTVYHMLFGIKLLGAFTVFFLAITLTSSRMKLFNTPAQRSRWAAVLVVIAVMVIMISGVLKNLPRGA